MTSPGLARKLKVLAKRTAEPLLYRLLPGYAFYRARHDWDRRARLMPREVTATFDAADWDTYWASGQRDLRLLLELARSAGPVGSELAVELGCGMGRLTRPLAEQFQRVVGTDISGEMLRLAREHAAAANISYEIVGPDGRLPLPSGVADLAIAWTVFRHTDKSIFKAYLDEIRRVLRPGGCLAFEAQIREASMRAEPVPYDSLTEREYTRSELQGHCVRHGFLWMAEQSTPSATPGTLTLIMAWRSCATE